VDERMRKSQAQEKRIARRTNGALNGGSGSGWRRQNDVRSEGKLHEAKRTDKKSIIIKLEDLEKVRRNALLEGTDPVFHIEIGNRRWVCIPEEDYDYGSD